MGFTITHWVLSRVADGRWCLAVSQEQFKAGVCLRFVLARAIVQPYVSPWLRGKQGWQMRSGCHDLRWGDVFRTAWDWRGKQEGKPPCYTKASSRHAPGWWWQIPSSFLAGSFIVLSPLWGLLHPWAKKSLLDLTAGMEPEFSISPHSWPFNSFPFSSGRPFCLLYIDTYSEITR